MNRYVFNYSGAPLKGLVVSLENGHLVQEGIMHKIIDIPFKMTADVSATPDGWIRIHPIKIEICNLNGAALMKAFGISLQKVLTKLPPGVRVEKNDTLIEPHEGHVVASTATCFAWTAFVRVSLCVFVTRNVLR